MTVINVVKFVNYCFQWESPMLSFTTFIVSNRSALRPHPTNDRTPLAVTGDRVEFPIVHATVCITAAVRMERTGAVPPRNVRQTVLHVGRRGE